MSKLAIFPRGDGLRLLYEYISAPEVIGITAEDIEYACKMNSMIITQIDESMLTFLKLKGFDVLEFDSDLYFI